MHGLARYRPGLAEDTLTALASMYGTPVWQRVHDPTSELILTILSANSADIDAEKAFDALSRRWPSAAGNDDIDAKIFRPGWGGVGIGQATPDWAAVEFADIVELTNVIRPGGLANQKAPRIQASLSHIREERGDYSLEFLGDMSPADALAWLTAIPGVGRKTASVVLLFSFGMPLIPVDRHVERVATRIGLVRPKVDVLAAHDYMAALDPARAVARGTRQLHHPRPRDVPRPATGVRPLRHRLSLPLAGPKGAIALRICPNAP